MLGSLARVARERRRVALAAACLLGTAVVLVPYLLYDYLPSQTIFLNDYSKNSRAYDSWESTLTRWNDNLNQLVHMAGTIVAPLTTFRPVARRVIAVPWGENLLLICPLAAIAVGLVGWFRREWRPDDLAVATFSAANLGAVLIHPWPSDPRWLLPLFPILLTLFAEGCGALVCRIWPTRGAGALPAVATSALVCAGIVTA